MLKNIVDFKTDRLDGEPRARLYIDNNDKSLSEKIVIQWFKDAGFQEPERSVENDSIVLFINYRFTEQGAHRPKDSKLIDAIAILNKQGLGLTDQAKEELSRELLVVTQEIVELKTAFEIKDFRDLLIYINAYQGAFMGLSLESLKLNEKNTVVLDSTKIPLRDRFKKEGTKVPRVPLKDLLKQKKEAGFEEEKRIPLKELLKMEKEGKSKPATKHFVEESHHRDVETEVTVDESAGPQ